MRFLLRLLITALAMWVATRLVPGIRFTGEPVALLGVALVFGVVNALLGTLIKLLALPLTILTLGLFALVINAFLLFLTARLSESLGLHFSVAGFVPAFWGALVIGVTRAVLHVFLSEVKTHE